MAVKNIHLNAGFERLVLASYAQDARGKADMAQRMRDLKTAAQSYTPIRPGRPGRPMKAELHNSFTTYTKLQGFFVKGVVQNYAPYAASVHDGARAHPIPGPNTFFWESPPLANVKGYPRKVTLPFIRMHPGIRSGHNTPFFTLAAQQLGYTVTRKEAAHE